jgi:hypothetical protein
MKIIITEDQNKILWLLRRLNDREIMDNLKDIVIEGFDYTDPCNYETYSSYETNLVNESAITFINGYSHFGEEQIFSTKLESFVAKVIVSKHRKIIEREYRDRYCDEDDDDEEDY